MYTLWDYRRMLDDHVRVDAYARALRAEVRPDDVVLDVGCGFGVFAILAARLGARMAYGVEPNPVVSLAPDLARENGVEDRVRFWRGPVEDIVMDPAPTRSVGDVRGRLPFNVGAVAAWNGALRRLAPGARRIPSHDTLMAQPMRSDMLHRMARALDDVAGVSMRCLGGALANGHPYHLDDECLLGTAQPLFEMRYDRPLVPRWTGGTAFALPAGTVVDGFVMGFEAHLSDEVRYRSFGPGRANSYGVCYMPCSERLTVPPDGRLGLRVRVEEGGPADAVILWAVDVAEREGAWQSELLGAPVPLDVVRAANPDHRPAPDAQDDLEAALLASYKRGRSVREAGEDARAALGGSADADKVERRAAELAQRRQGRAVRRYGP